MTKIAACLAALAALTWAGLRWFERLNLYIPDKVLTSHPGTYGLPYETVHLAAADGARLHGWYVPAAAEPAAKGPAAVVIFHGNAGNISNRLEKLRMFHALGLSVLLFDYRGYGESRGRLSERGTYLDAEAALDYLQREKGLPPERLAYYGESLGCAVALEAALRRPPRALILDSAFTSTIEMAKLVFPRLPARWLVTYRYDNIGKIARLKAPLLSIHSAQDEIVPFEMGRRLYEAAPEPKRFFAARGGHNEGFLETPGYVKFMGDFLKGGGR